MKPPHRKNGEAIHCAQESPKTDETFDLPLRGTSKLLLLSPPPDAYSVA
jgi:hypothetical protein